ncbi:SIALI-17 repeat-containing surface protein [Streptococcus parasanguinis]|uniref:SIALI-17 repeat-containing surface protein n=1 Tax=Streptococcus parasanguinis TaxID=1318 RepID=UPI00319DCB6A
MNKKVILAAVATIATVATAQGVYADEANVQGTVTEGNRTDTVTTAGAGQTETSQNETAQIDKQPATETAIAGAGSTSDHPDQSGNAAQFTKNGTDIQVTNPEVVIDQSKGTGKYQGFTVEYKNVHFPDDMQINQGDKVTFNLPEEITFQTAYEFDVTNPDNNVVGKASTDPASQTVTTVFNDYFANHPLNKQMSLKLDAKWTDKVESGKPVTVNFNGTVVSATIGKEQEIGKDELISKWGSQDKEDPTTINWTIRLNYARKTLNYVKIIDEMSDNQKLVDDYFVMNYVDSIDPWVDKGSAMDLIKSMSKSEHGFEITMDRLDRMVYIWYKTKLTNAVKDSTNPTNKVELKAENDGAASKSSAHLVGGRGDASGENKPEPTFEIPKESPKVEIPEFEGGIPGIPEVREKPEWSGGVVPNEAPMLELPELEIPDEPMKPSPDPKRDEPKSQPKQDKPNTPTEINSKPSKTTTEPQKEQVNVIYQPQETNAHTLPNTGAESGLVLSFAGMFILSGIARIALKREGE